MFFPYDLLWKKACLSQRNSHTIKQELAKRPVNRGLRINICFEVFKFTFSNSNHIFSIDSVILPAFSMTHCKHSIFWILKTVLIYQAYWQLLWQILGKICIVVFTYSCSLHIQISCLCSGENNKLWKWSLNKIAGRLQISWKALKRLKKSLQKCLK